MIFYSMQIANHGRVVGKVLDSPLMSLKQLRQIHAQFLVHGRPWKLHFLNSMLLGYARSPHPRQAFAFYVGRMSGIPPNYLTIQFLLKACSKSKSVVKCLQLHSAVLKRGFEGYLFVQNSVLHCYVVCGALTEARKMFDGMPQRNIVSFNSMINGYVECCDMVSAAELFSQVNKPNVVTWTAMVVGFGRQGDVVEARRIFDQMPEKDLVSWNAILSSYVQNHQPVEALHLFRGLLPQENLRPSAVTIATVLSACAGAGALDSGKWVHLYISKSKLKLDAFIGSSLIDMYSKCGAVNLALKVFEELKERNTYTWNALLNGLAMNGYARQTLEWFYKMRLNRNVKPDEVTFVAVLLACSHGGFVEEGKHHFHYTMKEYGVSLLVEHYACVVDLLGRAGLIKEAEGIVKNMGIEPDIVIWTALLGACKLHKNVEVAEWVIKEMKMEAISSGDYVLLSNLYASVGRWEDVERVRKLMKEKRIKKVPGCSSIAIDNTIHEFVSGDKSHPQYNEILAKLEELMKKMATDGYLAETSMVFYDIDEEEKEQSLGHHSEKLAICLGLISTPPGTTLRIVKNLRVCNDCHNVTKFISMISTREIVVRDRARFHHFKDGVCSCNNYW